MPDERTEANPRIREAFQYALAKNCQSIRIVEGTETIVVPIREIGFECHRCGLRMRIKTLYEDGTPPRARRLSETHREVCGHA